MSRECEYKKTNKCAHVKCTGAYASAAQCLTGQCRCPCCPWRRRPEPIPPAWPEWPIWPWRRPWEPMPIWC